jgi:hypothetical protein
VAVGSAVVGLEVDDVVAGEAERDRDELGYGALVRRFRAVADPSVGSSLGEADCRAGAEADDASTAADSPPGGRNA